MHTALISAELYVGITVRESHPWGWLTTGEETTEQNKTEVTNLDEKDKVNYLSSM